MNIKTLRRKLENVPDDTEVFIDCLDYDKPYDIQGVRWAENGSFLICPDFDLEESDK
jgi:hypothetical protein